MALTRRTQGDPLGQPVTGLRDEMNRLFDTFFSPGWTREMAAGFAPVVDLAETPESFVIRADVPGVDPSSVDINLTGNTLTLRGERREDMHEKEWNWYRVERSQGPFTRTFQLPDAIDPDRVSATYEKGVLTIDIAKAEAAKPRSIKVSVTGSTGATVNAPRR